MLAKSHKSRKCKIWGWVLNWDFKKLVAPRPDLFTGFKIFVLWILATFATIGGICISQTHLVIRKLHFLLIVYCVTFETLPLQLKGCNFGCKWPWSREGSITKPESYRDSRKALRFLLRILRCYGKAVRFLLRVLRCYWEALRALRSTQGCFSY